MSTVSFVWLLNYSYSGCFRIIGQFRIQGTEINAWDIPTKASTRVTKSQLSLEYTIDSTNLIPTGIITIVDISNIIWLSKKA